MDQKQTHITVSKDGPYIVKGRVPISVQVIETNADGESSEWGTGECFEVRDTVTLCRCGHSENAPFCDGSHVCVGFVGTETASREPFEAQKHSYHGPVLTLDDSRPLCAAARFCDAVVDAWTSVEQSDDPAAPDRVVHHATRCPSGRLVAVDNATGKPIEPELGPSIGVVEDPSAGCSGPLWVRGGIEILSHDGTPYEVRNRVTLCRCGQSDNKPFCDGKHVDVGYKDGLA